MSETTKKKVTKKTTKKTETAETPVETKKDSGIVAKSAFYYKGKHFGKGDDLSTLEKSDIEFLTERGKI